MTTLKTRRGAWKPGQSGNPTGKPPGSGELQRLRAASVSMYRRSSISLLPLLVLATSRPLG